MVIVVPPALIPPWLMLGVFGNAVPVVSVKRIPLASYTAVFVPSVTFVPPAVTLVTLPAPSSTFTPLLSTFVLPV